MIRVSINGETQEFDNALNVAAMLEHCGFEAKKVAVAINTDFVPRSQYQERQLANNDQIDVLAAVQGG